MENFSSPVKDFDVTTLMYIAAEKSCKTIDNVWKSRIAINTV